MELKVDFKYILKILIIVFLFLSIIVLARTILYSKGVVTIEGLQNFTSENSILSPSDAFCESHRGSSGTLDKSCKKLTNGNCNSTSCCVWTSDNKCAAGNIKGPTFNTNENGQTNQLDYYYFKGKCYGTNCPN
jgi:hypothetical protein